MNKIVVLETEFFLKTRFLPHNMNKEGDERYAVKNCWNSKPG